MRRSPLPFLLVLVFLLPPLAAALVPLANTSTTSVDALPWWETTNMDPNRDGVHESVWVAASGAVGPGWVDEENTISVIVDFDHTPSAEDQSMLEGEVQFQTQFRYHLIDSIAGRVPLRHIDDLAELTGVVLVELDGRLRIAMNDVKDNHGVVDVWEDTSYTGAGSVVAIIDTGIDSDHVGLDDLDDDNETNDPKVIAFFDVVNAPDQTNGTEIRAYDDQGHGTHCAGIAAGTGAPDYQYVGVAPQAQLVGVKVLDSGGSGSFATVMRGMEWTVEMRHVFNIRAASMSLGGFGLIELTSSEEESVNRMANEMMREGVALFIAAGNSAITAQIGTPGSAEDVITVGALDKDTGIAVYSSQGPTEEGNIKPNIAFTGSSVMAPDYNTGDGYTSKSGTSMATPGAAGLAALMYQANPDLSPFDVRNILQETATYRQCHYMLKNEPCIEDLNIKPRENNVYGHGHVNSLPAVMEAANKVYGIDLEMNVSLTSGLGHDSKVHIGPGESISFSLQGDPVKVQWRTWDMRDEWMDHADFDGGDEVEISHTMLVERLQFMPGNEIEGNQTIMLRVIKGVNASANEVVQVHVMGSEPQSEGIFAGGFSTGVLSLLGIIVILLGLIAAMALRLQVQSTGSFEFLPGDGDDRDP